MKRHHYKALTLEDNFLIPKKMKLTTPMPKLNTLGKRKKNYFLKSMHSQFPYHSLPFKEMRKKKKITTEQKHVVAVFNN